MNWNYSHQGYIGKEMSSISFPVDKNVRVTNVLAENSNKISEIRTNKGNISTDFYSLDLVESVSLFGKQKSDTETHLYVNGYQSQDQSLLVIAILARTIYIALLHYGSGTIRCRSHSSLA